MTHTLLPVWNFKTVSPDRDRLAASLGISPFLAHLLLNRGIGSKEDGEPFLSASLENLHNPFLLADMDRAVRRVLAAVSRHEKIVVYGDYDVDGTTSSALLYDFFRAIGVSIGVYIPDRLKEGYSLNQTALDELKAQGTSLIITVDNGIAALPAARYARDIGIDLIVTDHHELAAELPIAVAVVNSNRPDNRADFKGVAGVGVAFYLAMALRKQLRELGFFAAEKKQPSLRPLLDLVALGTVADLAPLAGQNRLLVKYGLRVMKQGMRPGLVALADVAKVEIGQVDVTDIGFRLGPRLNAGGRIGYAKDGFYLLTAASRESARPFALRLNTENERRRAIENEMLGEAQAIFESQDGFRERMACMVAHREFNIGVIGVVASRLVEKYRRPALVFGWDGKVWKGSARSVSGFRIHQAIGDCREYLLAFGGHAQAAGLSIEEGRLQDFYHAFDRVVSTQLTPEDCRKRIDIDMVLSEAIALCRLDELALLDPMGMHNPAPIFVYHEMGVRSIKRLSNDKHLKLSLVWGGEGFEALAFSYPKRYDEILSEKRPISVAFRPEANLWQGSRRLQLHIVDIK